MTPLEVQHPPLEVTAHPAVERPRASALMVAYFAAMALIAGPWLLAAPLLSWTGALGALLVFDVLVLSMSRWFFPTRYRFTDAGITVRFMAMERTYPYARFRSSRPTRAGLYLSPRTDPTRFDRFRGLHVLTRDPRVLDLLAEKLPAQPVDMTEVKENRGSSRIVAPTPVAERIRDDRPCGDDDRRT